MINKIIIASLLCLLLAVPLLAAPARGPALHRPVPTFTLPDTGGRTRSLAEFKGRTVALFFFCGCDQCHRCATLWGEAQGGNALARQPSSSVHAASPITVVVFAGGKDAARQFAAETGLSPAGTVLLLDPLDRIAEAYRADPCPRVFVVDAAGKLRYTNNEPGTDPQKTSVVTLVSRTLTAMHQSEILAAKAAVLRPISPPTIAHAVP